MLGTHTHTMALRKKTTKYCCSFVNVELIWRTKSNQHTAAASDPQNASSVCFGHTIMTQTCNALSSNLWSCFLFVVRRTHFLHLSDNAANMQSNSVTACHKRHPLHPAPQSSWANYCPPLSWCLIVVNILIVKSKQTHTETHTPCTASD